jgi:hypothetical protein
MKTIALLLGSSVALAHLCAQAPAPAETKPTAEAVPAPSKRSLLKYTPPKVVASGQRIDGDGGSRADGAPLPKLYVLAPKHIAFTTNEQPSLFWFQDAPIPKDTPVRLEITLIDPKNPKPLLKVGSDLAKQKDGGAGIHRVQLTKQNVKLDPGVAYQWSVALVPSPTSRSKDAIAKATIQRSEPSKELAAALEKAGPDEKAVAYAANGVWYDALTVLTDRIDKNSKDTEARALRVALLTQGDLKEAAAYDKK